MQIKSSLLVLSLFFSLHANAAFSAKESKELLQINDQHHVALSDAKKNFLASVTDAVGNDPDKKDAIVSLKESWEIFILSKCEFENLESKGTDAETAQMSDCLVGEYKGAEKYFEQVLP